MSLTLLQTYTAVNLNVTVPFGATGGSAPYTYSIAPGGAGGAIDASTGLYTAPSVSGVDTVIVTDSTSATDSGTVLVDYPILLVADIIETAMGLSQGQVYLYNSKINIPIDSRLYVAIGVQSSQAFANRPRYVGTDSGLTAIQSVNMKTTLSIDILSRSPVALNSKEQVLLALSSPYAEQQMELNSFQVAAISSSLKNLSQIDGTAIPYRFQFLVNIQYFTQLATDAAYFDTFQPPIVTLES